MFFYCLFFVLFFIFYCLTHFIFFIVFIVLYFLPFHVKLIYRENWIQEIYLWGYPQRVNILISPKYLEDEKTFKLKKQKEKSYSVLIHCPVRS